VRSNAKPKAKKVYSFTASDLNRAREVCGKSLEGFTSFDKIPSKERNTACGKLASAFKHVGWNGCVELLKRLMQDRNIQLDENAIEVTAAGKIEIAE
jgi:hypothetical protein